MKVLRSTPIFAAMTFLIAISGAYVLSTYFSLSLGQALGGILTWIGLILAHYRYQAGSETADDESTNTQNNEEPADHGDEPSQPESTPLNESATDQPPGTEHEDAAETPTPRRQSSLLRSNEDIIEEVEDKLGDRVELYDDGTIEIENVDDLNLYSRMMLYVIAKRIAHEYRLVETPTVTVEELREEAGERRRDYNRMEVVLFLDMAGGRLTPSHNVTLWTRDDYDDLENIEVSVGLKKLSEITDWALEEQRSSPLDLSIGLGNAAGWLSDASDTYSEMKKEQRTASYYNPEEDFETICDHVLTACSDAKAYPVEVERDGNWDKFTRYSAGVLRGVDSVSHHLPRAQKYLENMQNIADEERGW